MGSDNLDSGELRSGREIIHGFIVGNKFAYKPIKCSVIDGLAIYEGDILIGTANDIKNRTSPKDIPSNLGIGDNERATRGVGITDTRFRWPKRIIPYSITADLPNQERVTDAINHWEEKTDFQFVPRNSGSSDISHNNYISFEDQNGCFSSVGMQGTGKQVISLGPNCTAGNAIHEIGHTLGLWHEQSREDRDGFVKIVWENIEDSMWHNFEQHIVDGDDIGEYDFGSIMHYPRKAFSKNENDTVIPLGNQDIGQRRELSNGDIEAIESMYTNI